MLLKIILEEKSLGNYRSKLDIVADILHAVTQNAKKTHIMFQANLSYKVLKKYLGRLNEASLINFVCEKQCYTLTLKGKDFLDAYEDYSRNSRYLVKQLNEVNDKKRILEDYFLK